MLGDAREKYFSLLENPAYIEEVLQQGAERARQFATPFLHELRQATGIRKLS